MTDTDLIIISSLDQPIQNDDEETIRILIRARIEESAQKKDCNIALNVIAQLVKITKLGGISLAEALYLTKKNWEIYEMEDNFADVVFAHAGLHRHTTDRYVQVYEQLFVNPNIPEQLVDDVRNRNIRDLIPIAKALKQGYTIDEGTWEELAEAPDFNTVAKIVREDIKGAEPRSSGVNIVLKRDGTLMVYSKSDQVELGYLGLQHCTTSEQKALAEKALERIVKNSGVLLA